MDPKATAFRYDDCASGSGGAEHRWFDLAHFKFAMGHVFRVIDQAVLRSAGHAGRTWSSSSLGRVPKRNAARSIGTGKNLDRGRPIDLGDEWGFASMQKLEDSFARCHKRLGQLRKRRLPDHDQQRNAMVNHCRQFIGFVSNALIVRDRHPASLADLFEPDRVRAIRREVICVPLYPQAGGDEYFWKSFP